MTEDIHRSTAIEIFDNYFARAYKRKNDLPMVEKRYLRALDRAKKKEGLDDDYLQQFKLVFKDARKDSQGRVSSEALIDAIVEMIQA